MRFATPFTLVAGMAPCCRLSIEWSRKSPNTKGSGSPSSSRRVRRETPKGYTSVGPHMDDLTLALDARDARSTPRASISLEGP
jgi:hypothetical protein